MWLLPLILAVVTNVYVNDDVYVVVVNLSQLQCNYLFDGVYVVMTLFDVNRLPSSFLCHYWQLLCDMTLLRLLLLLLTLYLGNQTGGWAKPHAWSPYV